MNELTDIQNEVARYNAERRGAQSEQPVTPPTSDDPGPPVPVESNPTAVQEAGPPRLIGISFQTKDRPIAFVGTTLGNFELITDEQAQIARIAMRAVERAMKKTYADFALAHSITKPRKLRVVKRQRGRS